MNINELKSYGLSVKEIMFYLNKIRQEEAIVTFAGEFSAGKSTFLNALIKQRNYLPEGFGECTPVLLNLVKSDSNQITVSLKNDQSFEVDNTYDNRLLYAKHREGYDDTIHMLTIPVQSEFLKENVNYIDTPGSNTMLSNHIEISNYIITKSDIVIYVFNTSLSETDIERISEIIKYTSDIIFVLSHIDEESQYKSIENISRFVETAQSILSSRFNTLQDPVVLPVGSILAFEDDTYIGKIREYISDYLEENSLNVIKKRTENQLGLLFVDILQMLNSELNILNSGDDIQEIVQKMSYLEAEINKLIDANKKDSLSLKSSVNSHLDDMYKEIQIRVTRSKDNLCSQLNSNSSVEIVQKSLNEEKIVLDKVIKELSSKIILKLVEERYEETNHELNEICDTLKFENIIEILPPNLDSLTTTHFDQAQHSEQLELYKSKLDELNGLLLIEESRHVNDQMKIREYKMALNEVKRDIMILGPYQAIYEEHVIDSSGGKGGAKIGRVLGEIADIALLFYNPAGGAVAVADGVKDAAKIANTAGKFAKVASKGKEVVQKTEEAAKNTVMAYKNLKNQANQMTHLLPDNEEKTVLDLLDYLSLSFWGESIGSFIGEKIDPTRTILEESQEYRQLWEQERKEIETRGYLIQTEIINLQLQLEDTSGIAQKKKLKNQIEEKLDYQKRLMKIEADEIERETEIEFTKKVINHYTQAIETYFAKYLEVSTNGVQSVLNQAILSVEKQCELDLNRNVENLNAMMTKLSKSKDNFEEEVIKIKRDIEILSNYKGWINEWIEEASVS